MNGVYEKSSLQQIGVLLKIVGALILSIALVIYVLGFIDVLPVSFKRLGINILIVGIFVLVGGVAFDRIGSIQSPY